MAQVEPLLAYAVIGLGAAAYSPAKYGILPELADICNKIGIIDRGVMKPCALVADVMKQVRRQTVLHIGVRNDPDAAALRRVCDAHGVLLVVDEVMSGFRVARGGAAELYGITPDLATFGKVIGGGMPVGAFASTREIMKRLSPVGDVYQAGTLSGNPVAMSAGLASLDVL